jgi:hypothetical protein
MTHVPQPWSLKSKSQGLEKRIQRVMALIVEKNEFDFMVKMCKLV